MFHTVLIFNRLLATPPLLRAAGALSIPLKSELQREQFFVPGVRADRFGLPLFYTVSYYYWYSTWLVPGW